MDGTPCDTGDDAPPASAAASPRPDGGVGPLAPRRANEGEIAALRPCAAVWRERWPYEARFHGAWAGASAAGPWDSKSFAKNRRWWCTTARPIA